MYEIAKEVRSMIDRLIDRRLEAMKKDEAIQEDLLSLLLKSNNQEIGERGSKSFGMSMDDVVEECKVFYFAGQETTPTLLLWTLVLLSKYPAWQTKAREEILHVFGYQTPDFTGLSRLKIVSH